MTNKQLDSSSNFLLLALLSLASGFVPPLTGSTLFVWLHEQGVSLTTIGVYSLATLPLTFSWVTAGIINAYLSNCYQWLLVITMLASALVIYLFPYATSNLPFLFMLCFSLSFFMSIAHILLLTLQKTLFSDQRLLIVTNLSTLSYKLGLGIGGSLALYLSQYYSWPTLYRQFGWVLIIISAFLCYFPHTKFNLTKCPNLLKTNFWHSFLQPLYSLWRLPNGKLILLLMIFYRAPDYLITHYFDLFYLHYGLSKTSVAFGYKFYGMVSAVLGGICWIKLMRQHSYFAKLTCALLLHLSSYLLIYLFSCLPTIKWLFYIGVTYEEFSRGMTMIIFWAFQTHICQSQHALMQLTLLTTLDNLSYTLLSTIAGTLIATLGYQHLVLIVMLSFMPALTILKQFYRHP